MTQAYIKAILVLQVKFIHLFIRKVSTFADTMWKHFFKCKYLKVKILLL